MRDALLLTTRLLMVTYNQPSDNKHRFLYTFYSISRSTYPHNILKGDKKARKKKRRSGEKKKKGKKKSKEERKKERKKKRLRRLMLREHL